MQQSVLQSSPGLVEQFYFSDDLLQTKIAVSISCFFVIVLLYGDYLNFGIADNFYSVTLARIIFVLFSTLILVAISYVRTAQQHEYLVLIWSFGFILLSLYVNATRPITNINFSYVDTLAILAMFTVFPSNIYMISLLAGTLTLGDLIIITFLKTPVDELLFKTICLTYVLSNVLGYFVANRLRSFRQKHYSAFLLEQSARKELEHVAFVDQLTGALNRRKFFQLGAFEFDKFKSIDIPFSVIMLDLDFFKNLNDIFGHAAGDYYLQEFAKVIISNKRGSDILGRLGGEEFALILPSTCQEAAQETAERLRQICEEQRFYFDNQALHTTVSIGVTTAEKKDQTFQEVLQRADAALYHAKKEGRNQVYLKTFKEASN